MSKELENQKLNYVTQGDYCLPCIRTKEQTELHIGVWANRHRQHLKQHHRIKYYNTAIKAAFEVRMHPPLES